MHNVMLILCGVAAVLALVCWSATSTALSHLYKQSRMPRSSYEAARDYLKCKYVFARWVTYSLICSIAAFGGIVSANADATIKGWPAIVVGVALGLLIATLELYYLNCNRHDKLVVEHAKAMKNGQKNE